MNIIKYIAKFILGCFLVISLLGIIIVFEVQNTILNKNYIIEKFEESNYYDNQFSYIINSFNAYIGPSGLDEKIFNDIISSEKIKEDTLITIENLYIKEDLKMNTDIIKQKLDENINTYLEEENLKVQNDNTIIEFEDKIIQEYESNITYSNYLKYIKKITSSDKLYKIINFIKVASSIMLIIGVLGVVLINMKKIEKNISELMTFMLSCGIILEVITIFLTNKINIDNITIFNNSFSIVLRNIFNNIKGNISLIGMILIIISVIMIIINNTLFLQKEKKDV